jgi:hypothetical protein
MTRSIELGVASVLLLGSVFMPPFWSWRGPISFASVWVSCVLGLLAAQQGSKWWLVIPGTIIAWAVIGLYIGLHTY